MCAPIPPALCVLTYAADLRVRHPTEAPSAEQERCCAAGLLSSHLMSSMSMSIDARGSGMSDEDSRPFVCAAECNKSHGVVDLLFGERGRWDGAPCRPHPHPTPPPLSHCLPGRRAGADDHAAGLRALRVHRVRLDAAVAAHALRQVRLHPRRPQEEEAAQAPAQASAQAETSAAATGGGRGVHSYPAFMCCHFQQ